MDYRRDIDGLRAIAVLSVVLFHVDDSWLPGGFAGVDIFFVISGYLITSIITSGVLSDEFSLTGFYIRRIKRIVPALAVVLIATLAAAQFVLIPEHLEELALSAVASIFSAANIFFAYGVDTSYFADDSTTRPLLHIWSLGVEEQFYLLWPIMVAFLLGRLPKPLVAVAVGALFLIGIALSQWLTESHPVFAYYMLPSRAFQLLAGAFLALLPSIVATRLKRPWADLLGVVGLALIAFSLVWVDETLPYPGINAVPVTIGAALLILTGTSDNIVSRLLSISLLVRVGLISYSLYLWHWPLLAFARYAYVAPTLANKLAAIVIMVALAELTYRFVETPCRRSSLQPRAILLYQFGGPAAIITFIAAAFLATNGLGLYKLDRDYRDQVAAVRDSIRPAFSYDYVCQEVLLSGQDLTRPECIINGTVEPRVLLWGDSNAAHYVGILGALAKSQGFSFRNIEHSACPPILENPARYARPAYKKTCKSSAVIVQPRLAAYDEIIISAAWSVYDGFSDAFRQEVGETIRTLRSQRKRVVVIGQVIRFSGYDRKCSEKALKLPVDCRARFSLPRQATNRINDQLRAVAVGAGAKYLDFNDVICGDGICSPYDDQGALYFDPSHISMVGSWRLGAKAAGDQRFADLLGPDLNAAQ